MTHPFRSRGVGKSLLVVLVLAVVGFTVAMRERDRARPVVTVPPAERGPTTALSEAHISPASPAWTGGERLPVRVELPPVRLQAMFASGEPVPFAELRLLDLVRGEELLRATAGDDGSLEVPRAMSGRAHAIARTPKGCRSAPLSGGEVVSLDLGSGDQIITLRRTGAALHGIVRKGGAPVAGLRVGNADASRFSTTTTDLDGRFEFADLSPGFQHVTIGGVFENVFRERLEVAEGEAGFVLIDLPAGRLIVNLEEGRSTSLPLDGLAVALDAIPVLPDSLRRLATTSPGGLAVFDDLRPGRYLVSVGTRGPLEPGANDAHLAPAFQVVEVRDRSVEIALTILDPVELFLRAIDPATGRPVDALVSLELPGSGNVTAALPPSRYLASLSHRGPFLIPPGPCKVVVVSEDGRGECLLDSLPGETLERDVPLLLGSDLLDLEVTGEGAESIDRVFVLDRSGGLVWRWEGITLSGMPRQAGRFAMTIRVLPAGDYRLVCGIGRSRRVVATGDVALHGFTQVRLTMLQ